MAGNPYYNFIPAGNQQAAGTQAYGASAGPSPGYSAGGHSAPAAGQTSYDTAHTAYPNTAAFAAGYYGFPAKSNYEPSKNYFPGPPGPGKQDGQGIPPAHYQGYEAAFFNAAHAYLHHQSGPKAPQMGGGGGGQMPGNKSGHGGGGGGGGQGGPKTRGRYFAGGFNQRWTSSSTQQLHYCEVCKISCASPQTYKDHLDGQKHKKKEAAVRTGLPMVPTPRTGAALHCELCNVTCTSSDAYAAHIRGTKHQKVVKLHTKLGKPIPPAEPQLIHSKTPGASGTAAATPATSVAAVTTTPAAAITTATTTPTTAAPAQAAPATVVKVVAGTPKINFLGGNYLNTLGGPKANGSESEVPVAVSVATTTTTVAAIQTIKKEVEVPMTAAAATETAQAVVAQWEEEKVIQPVGQDYVEELRGSDGKITGFNCRLCDCRFNDVNAKDMHLKGRRHRLMYKKKVDPNLVVEAKGWPALRQKNKTMPGWQERRKTNEGGWEGNENYEEMPQAPSAIEDGNQPRPPAYWASPSRGGLGRHGGLSMGLPPPPQYFPSGSMPMGLPNPAMRKPESNDDRHVMAKHAEIYPSEAELEAIQTLVSYVERSLKLVSDQLTHQPEETTKTSETTPQSSTLAQSPVAATSLAVVPTTAVSQTATVATANLVPPVTPATATPSPTTAAATTAASNGPAQPQRMLKGVMRVGLLAKGLLLKGDRTVQLVVLCSQPPTYQLLDRVAQALPVHLSVVAPSITFNVETLPNEAVVMVKSVQGHGLSGDILVKVSLTSPVVREEQLAAAAATAGATNGTAPCGNDVDMNDDAIIKEGRLNTKDCLHSLALLRRAKWFQARANTLQNCVLVIRVMRDFCLRSPVWSNLDLWAIELIVERATFSAGTPLSPGDALRRVFETLSAGILLSNNDGWGPGIGDPCEKDAIDVCSNLQAQEREDMTSSAQQALRQIAFRQIFKVLGMPKPLSSGSRSFNKTSTVAGGPSPGKKRPRENSTSDAVSPEGEVPTDLKKEKIEGQDA